MTPRGFVASIKNRLPPAKMTPAAIAVSASRCVMGRPGAGRNESSDAITATRLWKRYHTVRRLARSPSYRTRPAGCETGPVAGEPVRDVSAIEGRQHGRVVVVLRVLQIFDARAHVGHDEGCTAAHAAIAV